MAFLPLPPEYTEIMEPNFREIAQKWQQKWREQGLYKTEVDPSKPKYYVLDMFPYPSGAGLHVGHPLGYIASDIVSRFKRLKGFNVLHPMGFDAFGLPAEQYAIQTGRHPADTTAENIARYKEQLNNIGFCYDWDREVNTSDPGYYKWTQWIFLQLFNCWFNNDTQQAEPIAELELRFASGGCAGVNGACGEHEPFTAADWAEMDEAARRHILMQYRLAYLDYATVNWCEALGTVLANDEVKDGLSERGGHPVEKRKMRQWFLRITAYAERLLSDLESLDWTDSMKEMQRNWIGKSEGAMVKFYLSPGERFIEVFTTRPDTLFGVDFLTLAPEHELVAEITTAEQKAAVEAYVNIAHNRSERERMSEVKRISGEFTGAFAIHPFTGKPIPVWVGDYVLAGYGTGAVMAVPAGDQRDWDFARHFGIPMTEIHEGIDISEAADPTKEAKLKNSGFLNGLTGHEAIRRAVQEIEAKGIGKGKVNYRLRDAGFSRQRYWGEPFPIEYRNGVAYALDESALPLELPVMDDFKPTGQPESPLAKATHWLETPSGRRETDTMPGYAGSSWYFLRYMDANNTQRFVGKEAEAYWQDVDVYIGGTEHAVGHLLYARFWQKFLFDRGEVTKNEPFRKLINQGMILGMSAKVSVKKVGNRLYLLPESMRTDLLRPSFTVNYPIEFGKFSMKNDTQYFHIEYENYLKCKHLIPAYNSYKWPVEFSTIKNIYRTELLQLIRELGVYYLLKNLVFFKQYSSPEFELNLYENISKKEVILKSGFISSHFLIVKVPVYMTRVYIPDVLTNLYNTFLNSTCLEKSGNTGNAVITKSNFRDELKDHNVVWPTKDEVLKLMEFHLIEKLGNQTINVNSPQVSETYDFIKKVCNALVASYQDHASGGSLRDTSYALHAKVEIEKMSKSKYNVVNPDDIIAEYGADTLRLYEMFLGPLEQSKPWNTNGIEGVYRFFKKVWNLFYNEQGGLKLSDEPATEDELRILHKTIRKVEEDIERFSFNTSVSTFMICVNELHDLKCHKRSVLQDFLIILSPYAPHIAEELWQASGGQGSVVNARFPEWKEEFIRESKVTYPVAFNGKTRYQIQVPAEMPQAEVQALALGHEEASKWLNGGQPKKVIVVPGRMVNIVL